MKLKCPHCQLPLVQIPLHGRSSHICAQKHGRAMTTSSLRAWLTNETKGQFDQGMARSRPSRWNCPRCQKKMNGFLFGKKLELDHCRSCSLTWLDFEEHEALPEKTESEMGSADIEMDVVDRLEFREGHSPYENIQGDDRKFPVLTIILLLLFATITHLARSQHYNGYVFLATDPFRNFGLDAILSIFTHDGAKHIMGNSLFFFIPGALIESTLGEKVLLQLFFLSAIFALVAQAIFFPESSSIGASAGIAGVYTALCLTQPQAMVVMQTKGTFLLSGAIFQTITNKVPIWMVFLTWIGQQILGGFYEWKGEGDGIGYTAHLAGALAGLLYVFSTDLKLLAPRK